MNDLIQRAYDLYTIQKDNAIQAINWLFGNRIPRDVERSYAAEARQDERKYFAQRRAYTNKFGFKRDLVRAVISSPEGGILNIN